MSDAAGLGRVLDRAHVALLAGDLTALADLAEEVELAVVELEGLDSAAAVRLSDKALRNERLLASAVKGVKAARRRALDLTDAGRFSTYDAEGQRDQHGLWPQFEARRI